MVFTKETLPQFAQSESQPEICSADTVQIEPIRDEHAAEYHAILDEVAKEQPYLGMTEAPPLECITEHVAEYVKNDYPMFVATKNQKVVGWCAVYTNQTPNFKHLGQLFVGVAQTSRGKGVGRALINAALAKGWANGLRRIELDVCTKNASAIALYQSFGFIPEGIKRCAYLLDDGYEDVLVMSLLHNDIE